MLEEVRCAAVCSPMRNDGGASEMRPVRHKRPLSLQGGKAAPCCDFTEAMVGPFHTESGSLSY